jgi:hypothetical protein
VLTRERLFGFAASVLDLTAQRGDPGDPHFIPLTRFIPGRFLSGPGLFGFINAYKQKVMARVTPTQLLRERESTSAQ